MSKRLRVALLLISLAIGLLGALSHKYLWMYASRKLKPDALHTSLSQDPVNENNPEALLAKANRLAWLFNWPKAEPLYVRAEELFKEKGDTRNEIYARVGRIRAQSETMSYVDVSQMIEKEMERPIAKADPTLRLWCLVQKGYTDLEINAASAKRAWLEAQGTRALTRRDGNGKNAPKENSASSRSSKVTANARRQWWVTRLCRPSRAATSGGRFGFLKCWGTVLTRYSDTAKHSRSSTEPSRSAAKIPTQDFRIWPMRERDGRWPERENSMRHGKRSTMRWRRLGKMKSSGTSRRFSSKKGNSRSERETSRKPFDTWKKGASLGRQHAFFRMAAQAMFDLAKIYRDAGDLRSAEDRASIGVEVSRKVGDRYYLPRDLTVLADLKARARRYD